MSSQVAHIEELLNEIRSGANDDKEENEEDELIIENWEDYETESEEEYKNETEEGHDMDHA